MKFADTTFLVDYLTESKADDGGPIAAYLDSVDTLHTPSLCLYEVCRGAVHTESTTADEIAEMCGWFRFVPFVETTAIEAAHIEQELHDAGQMINRFDILIAATVREADGTLVTNDADFQHIPGLAVETYP